MFKEKEDRYRVREPPVGIWEAVGVRVGRGLQVSQDGGAELGRRVAAVAHDVPAGFW